MASVPSTRPTQANTKQSLGQKNGASALYLAKTLDQAPRGGSPHSEAIASSEDEREVVAKKPGSSTPAAKSSQMLPPLRRGSWLQEVQAGPTARRPSQGGVSITSNNSQPSTPGEHGPWNPSGYKSASGAVSFNPSWPNESRREPPSRLTELPQPSSYFGSLLGAREELRSPGVESLGDESLQVRKAGRSQSYSVGQSEGLPDPSQGRARASFQAPRPSGLGDLREEDYSGQGGIPDADISGRRATNLLGRGLTDRRFSEMSPLRTDLTLISPRTPWNNPALPFDSIDEGSQSRRHSFAVASPSRNNLGHSLFGDASIEDDTMNALRRVPSTSTAHVTQDLSQGALPSPSQVRSTNYSQDHEYAHFRTNSGDEETAIELGQAHDRAFAQSYFSGVGPAMRSAQTVSTGFTATSSNTLNPFAPPSVPRPTKHLYIVTFKCSRSDVYYIPDNVGLEVKAGDMVIVEGDRGQDLGQVAAVDVSLEAAKAHLKEAGEQHFRWLMMFSRHVQDRNSAANPNGMLAVSNGEQYGREGGMGPRPPLQSALGDDLRPKMLKRLAQGHEIQVLRDKEGAEAKAKRVCQQKAIEHGLTMEILDAEYQLDYKKLTFFYYADCYINFNHLVTDLFKIYKARIWMSAVNPASFATPSNALSQLPPPSNLGPGVTNSANGGAFGGSSSMAVGPTYGRGAFSTPRTPGGLEVSPTEAQHDYADSQSRQTYNYAHAPAYGGFNPVAPAYAPSWMQNAPPVNRYMPYQYGFGGPGPSHGGYPSHGGGGYPAFSGQDNSGLRNHGDASQHENEHDLANTLQGLSINRGP
ncbi:PSP1 C-terminal conserved region-domain-containing protein [Phyllosticta citriasiana]|uniref:PSP1 C-terminal conserved region-domain-containing protein n=1 Tax=Phyllosticta citriasiana TaxID=595635 RepID=UPI0030FD9EEF